MRRRDGPLGSSGRLCKSLMMVTATSIKPKPRKHDFRVTKFANKVLEFFNLKLAKVSICEACKPTSLPKKSGKIKSDPLMFWTAIVTLGLLPPGGRN